MALSLAQRVSQLEAHSNESMRCIDVGLQFHAVVEAGGCTSRGRPLLRRTGDDSPVYGGRFDRWTRGYAPGVEPSPASVVHVECSQHQLALVLADESIVEASGGRGSGKSEGGVCKALRCIVERPHDEGQIVSPTFSLTKLVWFKLLRAIPGAWLERGKRGIQRAAKVLQFINGARVRFMSADNPDSLRSWGGGWSMLDEEQDITTEAVDIIWPSLRESERPQMWGTGTPKAGDYLDRHQSRLLNADAKCFAFGSYSNPFISKRAFDVAKTQMDATRWAQEIEADWSSVMADLGLVYHRFSRSKHCISTPFDIGRDVTQAVTKARSGVAKKFIAGVDYNWSVPNIAVIYQVFAPNKWVVVDIVEAGEHAGHLANALKVNGYSPSDVLVIDDASGEIKAGPHAQNSSTRLMRNAGYTCIHPNRNPSLKDSVNAVLAKLSPVQGAPSLFVSAPQAERLAQAMERLRWDGDVFDRDSEHVHWCDAMRYPISFFCPAARLTTTLTGVRMAN